MAPSIPGDTIMRSLLLFAVIAAMTSGVTACMSLDQQRANATEIQPQLQVTEVDRGRNLYQYWCATCHGSGAGAEGRTQLPGTAALAVKYRGAVPALLEDRTDLTPQIVTLFVRNGVSVMPFFRKTEISDEELAAIGAYLTRPRPAPSGENER